MRNLLIVVLVFVVCQTRLANAELSVYTTVDELMDWCEPYIISIDPNDDSYDVSPDNLCTGFITGVTDAHQRFVNNGLMPPYWCGPGGVSKNKLARLVTRYVQANRENLSTDAAGAVLIAVRETYPCT